MWGAQKHERYALPPSDIQSLLSWVHCLMQRKFSSQNAAQLFKYFHNNSSIDYIRRCGKPEHSGALICLPPCLIHTQFNLTHQKKSGEMIRLSWGVFPQSHPGSQKWLKFYESPINEKTLGPTLLTSHCICGVGVGGRIPRNKACLSLDSSDLSLPFHLQWFSSFQLNVLFLAPSLKCLKGLGH